MHGPRLPEIYLEAPEDPNPEKEYVYQAVYNAPKHGHAWIEAGSDDDPNEALDRLRLLLDQTRLVPLRAAVDIKDINDALEDWNNRTEPTEGDYIIQPDYSLAQVGETGLISPPVEDRDDLFRIVMDRCREQQLWSDVWFLDDHGGLYLFKAEEYPRFEEQA